MPNLPERPVEQRGEIRQYIIGVNDPTIREQIVAQLSRDPQVKLDPSTTQDSLIKIAAEPEVASRLKETLTMQYPQVIMEENSPLRPLESSSITSY